MPWVKANSVTGSLSKEYGNASGWAITQGDIVFTKIDLTQVQSPMPLFTFIGGILAFIAFFLGMLFPGKNFVILVIIGGLLATVGAFWALGGVTEYIYGGYNSISTSTGAFICLIASFITFFVGMFKLWWQKREIAEIKEEMKEEVKIGKTIATPLLYVNELMSLEERLMWGFIFGSVLFVIGFLGALVSRHAWNRDYFSSFEFFEIYFFPLWGFINGVVRRNRYYLCVEGVGFSGRRGRLYEWTSFNDFTIDNDKKQFKLNKSGGVLKLTTVKHFDRAKEILTQFIHPKE